VDAFLELVSELVDGDHRALVFSQFTDFLGLVREQLDQRGIGYEYLDGSTPRQKRQQSVEAFQAGSTPLFLISLKAGGFGLNLTAADYVIHLDPWWNPAVEAQATDRAHRIGQERPVTVYRQVTQQTIEESILELHAHKRRLADALLEGADGSTAGIEPEELLALLGPG
jgi:SNF2 family DNA or RNA helicase